MTATPNFECLDASHLDQIAACWGFSAPFDPCGPALLHEKIFEDQAVSPLMRFAVRDHGNLVGLCVACHPPRPLNLAGRGYIKLLAVNPAMRHHGIGSALLSHAEQLLGSAGVSTIRVAESAPNYLAPGIDQRDEATIGFLSRRGYVTIGEACNMHVDLTSQRLATAMRMARRTERVAEIVLRRAAAEDRTAVESFLQQHWAAWLNEVAQTFANLPISLHLAVKNENDDSGKSLSRVVGFSAYDANNRGIGWFGPMGTDPECQGMGIGRLLLLKCLDDIQSQGHDSAIIPWVAPIAFYQKHAGAEVSRRFVRMEKQVD